MKTTDKRTDLHIEKLCFSYGNVDVINMLDFSVEAGSFLGILGPNGSGKTTLVKLITKVIEPESGEIELMGEPLDRWNPRRMARALAVVPQATHISFPFSALEVVLMGRGPHLSGLQLEGKDDLDIARSAMEQTETWELRGRAMDEISGGEAQRVIVARALAQKPRILLLDEPTTHLDIKHQIAVMELIKKLNRESGMTVLVVSHDLNLIARYADRVVLLKDGAVKADGTPAEVLTAQNIRDVYEARVEVFDLMGRPGIFPAGPEISGGAS